MGLLDDLRQLSEQVRRRAPTVKGKGEEATKTALILPFLQVLGYDVFDPTEVQPEYVADFAADHGKRRGQLEKVDYAIHLKGQPAVFVECKAADETLDNYGGQLARYFNATPSVTVAILTNGIAYRFFTDLRQPNVMDQSPFFELDMLNITERDADILRPFQKAMFEADQVHTHAEELIYVSQLTKLVNELLRNPSESFIRFLLKEIAVADRVGAKLVEKFIPIVKKAIQSTLLEMATRSIRAQTEEPAVAPLPTAAAPAVAQQAPALARAASGGAVGRSGPPAEGKAIVTTPEELEIYDIVKRICADSPNASRWPVQHRDAINYFTLNLGRKSTWFIRAFCDTKRKSITTRLPVERAVLLCPGFEVEASPSTFGVSRVYVTSPRDLERLRPLVLLAYEEEVKRIEAGEDIEDTDVAEETSGTLQ